MKDRKWCVYVHLFPNGKRYIGITSKTPNARWEKGEGYKAKNSAVYNAIKKYGWDSIEHIVLYKNLTQQEAFSKEKELIAKYKTNIRRYGDKFGYNMTDGGEGTLGHKVPQECRDKLRQRFLGKTGAECINSRAVLCDGIEYSSLSEFEELHPNLKGNISGWLLGTVGMPPYWYNKNLCYKDLGTEITYVSENYEQRNRKAVADDIVFDTLKECGDYLGVTASSVSLYLRNKKSPPEDITQHNLRYEDEEFHVFKAPIKNRSGRACQCEYDGKTFCSIKELADFLQINKGTLHAWLIGKNKMPEQYSQKGLRCIK